MGVIDGLISLFMGGRIKKDVDKLKNSTDWKELWTKINTTRDEIEMYNDRFEELIKKCREQEAEAKRKGFKLVASCDDIYKNRTDIYKNRRK